jgi:hypothetical protein
MAPISRPHHRHSISLFINATGCIATMRDQARAKAVRPGTGE